MGFNSAFKGLKIVKNPGNGRLNNLNVVVLIVLKPALCASLPDAKSWEPWSFNKSSRLPPESGS